MDIDWTDNVNKVNVGRLLVEAETEEQAQKLFIEACKEGDESEYDEVELDYSEPIFETWSPISLEDNEGYSTIEIINENGNLIWENGK